MDTDMALGDDPSGVFQARAIFSRVRTFRTQSTFIAPVEYPALSLLTLTAGHLTHYRICPSLLFRLQDRQDGLGHPFTRDMHRHHRCHCGPGPERGFPGQRARVHCGRGHRVGCRPGACMCGPGRPGGETLDFPQAACAALSVELSSLPRPHSSSTTSRPPNN
jgi:hypothetical protein